MNVKEKLVELLGRVQQMGVIYKENQMDETYPTIEQIRNTEVAARLIANGVTVQEWISVDDELPEEKVNCIVHYKHAYCDNDDYWAIGICFYDGEKFQMDLLYKVTHWMPMPAQPKGE